jgi:hypothetical protein
MSCTSTKCVTSTSHCTQIVAYFYYILLYFIADCVTSVTLTGVIYDQAPSYMNHSRYPASDWSYYFFGTFVPAFPVYFIIFYYILLYFIIFYYILLSLYYIFTLHYYIILLRSFISFNCFSCVTYYYL